LGTTRSVDPFALRSYAFDRLATLARNNVPAAVVGRLAGEDLSRVRSIVLLHRDGQTLPDPEARLLRDYVDQRRGSLLAPRWLLHPAANPLQPLTADGRVLAVTVGRHQLAYLAR